MSPFVLAVVAAVAVDHGAIAIALDDGTVWRVGDGEWEEIGACPDGEVAELAAGATLPELDAGATPPELDARTTPPELDARATATEHAADAATAELTVTCGDGSAWSWSQGDGWTPVDTWSDGDGASIIDALDAPSGDVLAAPPRSWWPQLDVIARATREDSTAPAADRTAPIYEGWVRLRWDL